MKASKKVIEARSRKAEQLLRMIEQRSDDMSPERLGIEVGEVLTWVLAAVDDGKQEVTTNANWSDWQCVFGSAMMALIVD